MSIDIFILKSKEINKNRYDYSLVEYVNNKTKVKLICGVHGIFEQRPDNHINQKQQCPMCNNYLINFINKSISIHNNKYDYSLVNYKNNRVKVEIICPIHGEFKQTPELHKKGYGCKKCGNNLQIKVGNGIQFKRKTLSEVINDFMDIHDDRYDYRLVDYKNNRTKVKIICPTHGIFEQSPSKHLIGQGCPPCSKVRSSYIRSLGSEKFIERSNNIHLDKYDYSLVEYVNNQSEVKIICPTHGIFEQIPSKHLIGQECPKCKSSQGEREIMRHLGDINYIHQYRVDNMYIDFYLPDFNIFIEYDGVQHYESVEYFGGIKTYILGKKNDLLKNKYCKENGIKLIRIPYYEINLIKPLLKYYNIK